jgi:hypothetical protein
MIYVAVVSAFLSMPISLVAHRVIVECIVPPVKQQVEDSSQVAENEGMATRGTIILPAVENVLEEVLSEEMQMLESSLVEYRSTLTSTAAKSFDGTWTRI